MEHGDERCPVRTSQQGMVELCKNGETRKGSRQREAESDILRALGAFVCAPVLLGNLLCASVPTVLLAGSTPHIHEESCSSVLYR